MSKTPHTFKFTPKGFVGQFAKTIPTVKQNKPYSHGLSPPKQTYPHFDPLQKMDGVTLPKLPMEIGRKPPMFFTTETPQTQHKNKLHLIGARIYKPDPNKVQQTSLTSNYNPKNISKYNLLRIHSKYTFVEFTKAKSREVGIVLEHKVVDQEEYYVTLTRDGEYMVEPNQINYHFTEEEIEKNQDGIHHFINKCREFEDLVSIEKVESLWRKQLNNRKSSKFSCSDASFTLFEESNSYTKYASFRILSLHSHYFRPCSINFEFECRSVREVEDIKNYISNKNETKNESPVKKVSFDDLLSYALGNVNLSVYETHLKPLGLDKSIESAYQTCVKLGLWKTNDCILNRSTLPIEFDPEVLKEAESIEFLSDSDPDHNIRRNLKHLRVYAIDDKNTMDVDDAMSIEIKDEKTILYIHIADVTRLVPFGSLLQQSAFERVSSVYLPSTKISMIPSNLSEGCLSLSNKHDNYCVTFQCTLDEKGQIESHSVYASLLSPIVRLDYDELDLSMKLAQSNQDVLEMNQIALKRSLYRYKGGANAFNIPKPEVKVKGDSITLVASNESSVSRRMVQEWMILANEIASKFAHENKVSIPNRGTIGGKLQEEIISLDGLELQDVILLDYTRQNGYVPTCITQIPSWHQGLGIMGYSQVTSPIRRSMDLLIHYQLKAFLHGREPIMNWDQIQVALCTMEPRNKQIANVSKNSEKYWICKYFEENKTLVWKGLILDCEAYNYALDEFKLEIYLLQTGVRTRIITRQEYSPRDVVDVIVSNVVPFDCKLEFQLV